MDRIGTCQSVCKMGAGTATGRKYEQGRYFASIDCCAMRHCGQARSNSDDLCGFEIPVIERLARRHSAEQLARFHNEFVINAAKAERLYLDFPRFLERHLTKIYEKSLP